MLCTSWVVERVSEMKEWEDIVVVPKIMYFCQFISLKCTEG